MAWIESHDTLARHPKTLRAARLAGVTVPQVIGHLHLLWWFALDYADDGDLSSLHDEELEAAMLWPGEPGRLMEALTACAIGRSGYGFVERDELGTSIHDWLDYAGKLVDRRGKLAARGKSMREAYADGTIAAVRKRDGDSCRYCSQVVNWQDRRGPAGGTYDHVDPAGPSTAENLVVSCRSCNSGKRDRTPGEAGMTLQEPTTCGPSARPRTGTKSEPRSRLATVPNQTLQNQELRSAREPAACGKVDNSEEKPEGDGKTHKQGNPTPATTESFAVDVVRCGARQDVAAIAGVDEAGNLYNVDTDLGATAARLGYFLRVAAGALLPEADEAEQLEAARTMMRAALRRARSAHERQPIDNLPAYLTAMRKKATHAGDVAGDDVVAGLRRVALEERQAGGKDRTKTEPTKVGDILAGMSEGAVTL